MVLYSERLQKKLIPSKTYKASNFGQNKISLKLVLVKEIAT